MEEKRDIKSLTYNELVAFCKKNNLPNYRAQQISEWLWNKSATSFEEMTSLPLKIRSKLKTCFTITYLKIFNKEKSIDGTIKYSFQTHDNLLIEGVLIPSKKRITACVSSQIGCSLACNFCATGTLKLKRNLTFYEIYEQVFLLNLEAKNHFKKHLSNIVFMGMGEPLLNYNALINSINLISSEKGLNFSPKRITVSTAGIAKIITKLGDDKVRFKLAISLHSANDDKRSKLMDINKKIPLNNLKNAISYYYKKTKNKITYEYILFDNINDNINDAEELAEFIKSTPCKINLIEYNNIDGLAYKKSSRNNTINFIKYLEKKNITVTLRKSKGEDINAACGQLVNKLS